jgi:hypothetical protein
MYQVQEFVAGKWFPICSYDDEQEAKEHSKKLPHSRIKKITK